MTRFQVSYCCSDLGRLDGEAAVLLALVKPLGAFMARVYGGQRTFLTPVLGPVERLIYRAAGVRADEEMNWQVYALALLAFNFVLMLGLTARAEQHGNPALAALGVDQTAGSFQAGGNMEGKEVRFGIAGSALWVTATTAASNGSVNTMHDSLTPLGGLAAM